MHNFVLNALKMTRVGDVDEQDKFLVITPNRFFSKLEKRDLLQLSIKMRETIAMHGIGMHRVRVKDFGV